MSNRSIWNPSCIISCEYVRFKQIKVTTDCREKQIAHAVKRTPYFIGKPANENGELK